MEDHPLLFAAAKWFSPIGFRNLIESCHEFADAVGPLTGNLPVQPILSNDWCTRIAVSPSILRHAGPCGRDELSLRSMHTVIDCLNIPQSETLIPHWHDCDTWTYRTECDRYYLD